MYCGIYASALSWMTIVKSAFSGWFSVVQLSWVQATKVSCYVDWTVNWGWYDGQLFSNENPRYISLKYVKCDLQLGNLIVNFCYASFLTQSQKMSLSPRRESNLKLSDLRWEPWDTLYPFRATRNQSDGRENAILSYEPGFTVNKRFYSQQKRFYS